jgi:phospholipase/carboxylesterase
MTSTVPHELDGFQLRLEPASPALAAPSPSGSTPEKATQRPALLLLHGTGGDENDLIEFGRGVALGTTLLGLRGQVREGWMNRWFRRHGEGIFDLPDLEARAAELAGWLERHAAALGLTRPPVAVGYSNGANIAAALLMRHPGALSGAVLMRAMNGLSPRPDLALTGCPVLLLSGRDDPLAPPASRRVLVEALLGAGANVSEQVSAPGHGLAIQDIEATRDWYARQSF